MERQRLGAEHHPWKTETQWNDTESSQKEVLCTDEENWAQHRTLWHTTEKVWDLWDMVTNDDWLCSICQIRRNQESAVPEMPYMRWSLSRSMQWSVVSETAERSKSVRRETLKEWSLVRGSLLWKYEGKGFGKVFLDPDSHHQGFCCTLVCLKRIFPPLFGSVCADCCHLLGGLSSARLL